MLTERQIEILRLVQTGFSWNWGASHKDNEAVRGLFRKGYVQTREDIGIGVVEATQAGIAVLESLAKDEREKQADEESRKKEQRSNRRFQILNSAVSAAVGAIVGVICTLVFQWIAS